MNDVYSRIVDTVYNKLGYTVDDEIKEILLSDHQHKLVRAPAGGTKTSLSQMWLNLEKVRRLVEATRQNSITPHSMGTSYNTENLFCCVYNKHNVQDLISVHKRMYYVFESLKMVSNDPNSTRYSSDSIHAATMHSFAFNLVRNNLDFFKLRAATQTSEYVLNAQLRAAVQAITKKDIKYLQPYRELYSLYSNLMLFRDGENLEANPIFASAAGSNGVEINGLKDAFMFYDKQKKRLRLFDYSDWLKMAVELLLVPEIADSYRRTLRIIVADEIQDFTKLMFEVYRLLVSDHVKTLAIGDSDQTIYEFNGASPDNIDKYEELVGVNVKRFDLTTNRRCSESTFAFARNIIQTIPGRKPLDIKTVKDGGRFEVRTYTSFADEADSIVQEIQNVSYGTTAVLFRKRLDCLPLSRKLYEMEIPTNYLNATPFNLHPLYNSFVETIKALFLQRTRETWKHLYKILPFKRDVLKDFFGLDSMEVPTAMPDILDWTYVDFSPLVRDGMMKESPIFQIIFAQGVAEKISSLSTNQYMEMLLELFWVNHYKYILDEDDLFVEDVKKWLVSDFSTHSPLSVMIRTREGERFNRISTKGTYPLTICTIHATKGLEFDRVIMAHMEEELLRPFIASAEVVSSEEAADTRLHYVGATRQRKCLILYYNEHRPHRLIKEEYFAMPEKIKLESQFSGLSELKGSNIFSPSSDGLRRQFSLKK